MARALLNVIDTMARRCTRGITRFEAGFGLAVFGVLSLVGTWALSAGRPDDKEATAQTATQILQAAEEWQTKHNDGCPTITVLKADGDLEKSARADDAWGERLRVQCRDSQITVRSAGRDGKLNTTDDLSFPASSS